MALKECVNLLLQGDGLPPVEIFKAAFREIMEGSANDITIASLLVLMEARKASTPDVIRACADIMLDFAVPVTAEGPDPASPVVDIVGTGGDGKDAFNVSTAAGLVMAACGITVAKHGNRSSSGKIGSADFLEALGARINLDASQISSAIKASGFGFIFAQQVHPAMKHVAAARKNVGTRTIFNLLGPLTNPASPTRGVIGVSSVAMGAIFAELLQARRVEHVLVVHSTDGLDEISPAADTHVWEVKRDADIFQYTIGPRDFGVLPVELSEVCDLTMEQRVKGVNMAFANYPSAIRTFIAINAAAGLYVAGMADDFKAAMLLVDAALEDGRVRSTLKDYVRATNQHAGVTSDASAEEAGTVDKDQSNVVKVESYVTEGDVHITCCQTDVGDAEENIRQLSEDLDARLGSLMLSDYETPGRYSKWMQGFINPPVMLVTRDYGFTLKALNERGYVLLAALRKPLETHPDLTQVECQETSIAGTVVKTDKRFPEEERSRQPSVFTVVRVIQQVLKSDKDSLLGLYGAFGYDLTFQFEPTKLRKARPSHQRDLVLFIPDEILVWDPTMTTAHKYSYDFAVGGSTTVGKPRDGPELIFNFESDVQAYEDHSPGQYADKVRVARQKFKRGDLFEAVLSQTFYEPCTCPPSELFRRLRVSNPAPFTFIMNLGSTEYLVGASPEMYVRVQGQRVETCPISGTIKRGADPVEDAIQIRTILSDPKEESELTMCTDVDRNDKSRICQPGSVKVIGRRQIEMYSRLIHTVDHVEGQLREGFDALDAFLCHTWAVTVTGAPKTWAMQFVEDMEETPRGWYAGAVGALHFNGDMNTGLTLRTVQIHNGLAAMRAGATLLFDSDPDKEEAETRLKASAFLDALRVPPEALMLTKQSLVEREAVGAGLKILVIDHEDSFVHTVSNYLRQTGAEVVTLRAGFDKSELKVIKPNMALLSPGPGCPDDFKLKDTIASLIKHEIPMFGVCLGLQAMVEYFGGSLDVLDYPLHGKPAVVKVVDAGSYVFKDLPREFTAARYHSLHATEATVPTKALKITAIGEDGVVLGVEHKSMPMAAVQFHPESILTAHTHGLSMLENVIKRFKATKGGFKKKKTMI
eukprot:TRINITY_DN11504_c0_g1_i4.p1 TRINITY_DN11504_c0_g1~~TRINITY_DN11504_c0_g1_i4.p1  ORF type:complete len:1099 (+),score=299.79 TRINITY_DN11504_c0_g1_i4:1-3297(+)